MTEPTAQFAPITAEFEYTLQEISGGVRNTTRRQLRIRLWLGLLGWCVFIVLAVFFFMLLNKSSSHSGSRPAAPPPGTSSQIPSRSDILRDDLPWLAIPVFFIVMSIALRSLAAKGFKSNPLLHHRWILSADATGLTMSHPLERSQSAWGAFSELRQTPTLFLLHKSPGYIVIVPKRVFATTADADAFWKLAERHISPRMSAFPVLRVGEQSADANASAEAE